MSKRQLREIFGIQLGSDAPNSALQELQAAEGALDWQRVRELFPLWEKQENDQVMQYLLEYGTGWELLAAVTKYSIWRVLQDGKVGQLDRAIADNIITEKLIQRVSGDEERFVLGVIGRSNLGEEQSLRDINLALGIPESGSYEHSLRWLVTSQHLELEHEVDIEEWLIQFFCLREPEAASIRSSRAEFKKVLSAQEQASQNPEMTPADLLWQVMHLYEKNPVAALRYAQRVSLESQMHWSKNLVFSLVEQGHLLQARKFINALGSCPVNYVNGAAF